MEVINNFENKLIGRIEVDVVIDTNGQAMKRDQIKAEIAKKFKAKEELIVLNKADPTYGSTNISANAFIYSKKETLEKLTPKHIQKRNETAPAPEAEEAAPAAETAPAEESAEAATEEAPAEAEASAEEEKKRNKE